MSTSHDVYWPAKNLIKMFYSFIFFCEYTITSSLGFSCYLNLNRLLYFKFIYTNMGTYCYKRVIDWYF